MVLMQYTFGGNDVRSPWLLRICEQAMPTIMRVLSNTSALVDNKLCVLLRKENEVLLQ